MNFTSKRKSLLKLAAAIALIFGLTSFPASAELKTGVKAPDFTLITATDGKVENFTLSKALRNGPVIIYFYPKAFTSGCSFEAREFSQAMPKFKAKHVTVIGVSADGIDVLKEFSKKDCAGQFAVASDKQLKVTKAYDAKLPMAPLAARISYLITQDGRVAFVHSNPDASTHVNSLLNEINKFQ